MLLDPYIEGKKESVTGYAFIEAITEEIMLELPRYPLGMADGDGNDISDNLMPVDFKITFNGMEGNPFAFFEKLESIYESLVTQRAKELVSEEIISRVMAQINDKIKQMNEGLNIRFDKIKTHIEKNIDAEVIKAIGEIDMSVDMSVDSSVDIVDIITDIEPKLEPETIAPETTEPEVIIIPPQPPSKIPPAQINSRKQPRKQPPTQKTTQKTTQTPATKTPPQKITKKPTTKKISKK